MRSHYTEVYDAEYRVGDKNPDDHKPPKRNPGPIRRILKAMLALLSATAGLFRRVKYLATGVTALVSVLAYALWLGWQFAIGIVVLIFIHEMGHVIALRRYGVKASAPIFIPFLGAFIAMKQLPRNAYMEAVVGLGGPVIGSLGALAAWFVYQINGDPMFLAVAYLGVLLNLFNLLPVLPLDGGRAVGAMSRWFWVAGYLALIGLMIIRPTPFILIILLLGAPEVWFSIRNDKGSDDYYEVPVRHRLAVGGVYFGMIALLGGSLVGMEPLLAAHRMM
jgi:Zn-dependent protease